jgi:glutamate/tyrosine decarboxylase-like PLP-dependent enzyme
VTPGAETPLLTLSREEMQRFGYRVVDAVVDHIATVEQKPVTRGNSHAELARLLAEPLPETGSAPDEVLSQVVDAVCANVMHVDHPRYFAFTPGPGNFIGAMADTLASGFNIVSCMWLESAGAAELELVTIEWLRQICGLDHGAGGVFVSGGSEGNLLALAVARRKKLADDVRMGTVYASSETHFSINRALAILGFKDDQLRVIPSDAAGQIPLDALRTQVESDRAGGARPFCVVANAGTTNTGAIDPLDDIASFCAEQDLWLHVDGAYGAAAILCDDHAERLRAIRRADSLVIDPHKWLFQPFESGCVLLKHGDDLPETFGEHEPEYLRDSHDARAGEVNFGEYGFKLSRGFTALKLWMSFKTFGVGEFRKAVAHGIGLAEFAQETIEDSTLWELVTPAQLGIVTFRLQRPASPGERGRLHGQVIDAIVQSGFAMMSSTTLDGETVLRLCTINPRTTRQDITRTIDSLSEIAEALPEMEMS